MKKSHKSFNRFYFKIHHFFKTGAILTPTHELILANKAKNSFVLCNMFLGKRIIITGIISFNYLGSVRETKNNNQLIIKTR